MATIQLEHVTKFFPVSNYPVGSATGASRRNARPTRIRAAASLITAIFALDDINLTIQNGETLSIIGPSGCGKTTLLRVIAGLEPMTSGRVLYDRQDMLEVSPGDRGIGIVFQSYALYPNMNSKNNLGFFFRMHKREPEIDERVKITAQILGIDFNALLERMPSTLSAGQKQRVALGRCIVRDPKLILLDEPLSNLDAKLRAQTRAELKRLLRRFEVTSIYVTHDQIEAIALADRLAVMRWGRVEQIGSYWDVYHRPINTFVGSFVGSPPMNFLPAHIHADGLEVSGVRHVLPHPNDRFLPALPVIMGIRPEDMQLTPADDPMAVWLYADVVEYLPSEASYFVHSNIGSANVTAQVKSETPIRRGDRVPVRFVFEHASYFDPKTQERVA